MRDGRYRYRGTALLQLVAPNLPDASKYEAQRERNHSIEGRYHYESHGDSLLRVRPRSLAVQGLPNRFLGLGNEIGGPAEFLRRQFVNHVPELIVGLVCGTHNFSGQKFFL